MSKNQQQVMNICQLAAHWEGAKAQKAGSKAQNSANV
jgi:hypothetical protein